MCKKGDKGNCRNENATYKISCSECEKIYIGETSKNAFTRGRKHTQQLKNKDKQSVLYRHLKHDHRSEMQTPKFNMTVIRSHRNALDRQITEAVKINNTDRDKLMNNKTEWGHHKMLRMEMKYD